MHYSLTHLVDQVLLRNLTSLVAQDRQTTATLLAYLAEVDSRKLYLPAAYPSMHAYCVHELRLSEDAAFKRIQAARVAKRFPAIFESVADGRLHVTAVCLLAQYLAPTNAADLLEAAAHKTRAQIEELLAHRFPRTEMLALVEALPATASGATLAVDNVMASTCQLAPERVEGQRPSVIATAPQRFALHLSMSEATRDKLEYAQELLSHQVPTDDVAQVLDRALDALIIQLEKQKFAATSRPQKKLRPTASPRHVPATVKRAVWERDGGRCTFVSDSGQRCPARRMLELDHVYPVARGGEATADNMRLRCRAHNQFGAEQTFGTEFMRHKREAARLAAAEARARAARSPAL